MANMMSAAFVVILCFMTSAISEHAEEIDVHQEILNLIEARLDQKDLEIVELKQQLGVFTMLEGNKRLVMEKDFEREITNLKTRLDEKDKEIKQLKQQQGLSSRRDKDKRLVMEMDFAQEITNLKKQQGSTYIRWGRTTCPSNGTNLVYSGYMAGTYHVLTAKGSGANYLCLSEHPTWDHYSETANNDIVVTGVEYQFYAHAGPGYVHDLPAFFGSDIYNDEAPCSVCRSSRSTNVMIPGRTDCYPGWTKEYSGYLVGAYPAFDDGSEYVCLDRRPETVVNSGRNDNTNLLYFVEARCDSSLECPPYINNRELACVVCSL